MALAGTIDGDYHIGGNLSAKTMTIPAGTLTNAGVNAAAAIDATKLVHRIPIQYAQATGSAVAAQTLLVHICHGAATLVSVEAVLETIATGADRTVDVDVKKGNAGSAFATVLTAPIAFTNASVARTVSSGTLSTTACADNDVLQVTVAVAGAAGNQALGLCVVVTLDQQPS